MLRSSHAFAFLRVRVRDLVLLKARIFPANPSSYFYPAMNFRVAAAVVADVAWRFSIVDLTPATSLETADHPFA